MRTRNSVLSLVLIGLMLVMPMAAFPVRAASEGPSMWLMASRVVNCTMSSCTVEIWTIGTYDAGPVPIFALQAHMSYYSITYEYVTLTDYYDGDSYLYTEANGSAVMWGTLGYFAGGGGEGDGGPEFQAAPASTSWSSQARSVSSELSLHGARGPSALPHAPAPLQVGYGESDGFYWTEPNIGGRGVLLAKPDGRSNDGTPELALAFSFTGNSPNTQSKVIAAGSFTANEVQYWYGGEAYVVGASVKLTGQVYSFDYLFDYDGNMYGYSLIPTGQTATHNLLLSGTNGFASGWYVDGSGYPAGDQESVFYLATWGTPWFPAAYWWD